jgi:hypothetical protein
VTSYRSRPAAGGENNGEGSADPLAFVSPRETSLSGSGEPRGLVSQGETTSRGAGEPGDLVSRLASRRVPSSPWGRPLLNPLLERVRAGSVYAEAATCTQRPLSGPAPTRSPASLRAACCRLAASLRWCGLASERSERARPTAASACPWRPLRKSRALRGPATSGPSLVARAPRAARARPKCRRSAFRRHLCASAPLRDQMKLARVLEPPGAPSTKSETDRPVLHFGDPDRLQGSRRRRPMGSVPEIGAPTVPEVDHRSVGPPLRRLLRPVGRGQPSRSWTRRKPWYGIGCRNGLP